MGHQQLLHQLAHLHQIDLHLLLDLLLRLILRTQRPIQRRSRHLLQRLHLGQFQLQLQIMFHPKLPFLRLDLDHLRMCFLQRQRRHRTTSHQLKLRHKRILRLLVWLRHHQLHHRDQPCHQLRLPMRIQAASLHRDLQDPIHQELPAWQRPLEPITTA